MRQVKNHTPPVSLAYLAKRLIRTQQCGLLCFSLLPVFAMQDAANLAVIGLQVARNGFCREALLMQGKDGGMVDGLAVPWLDAKDIDTVLFVFSLGCPFKVVGVIMVLVPIFMVAFLPRLPFPDEGAQDKVVDKAFIPVRIESQADAKIACDRILFQYPPPTCMWNETASARIPLDDNTIQGAHAPMIRDFVDSFVAFDRSPDFRTLRGSHADISLLDVEVVSPCRVCNHATGALLSQESVA